MGRPKYPGPLIYNINYRQAQSRIAVAAWIGGIKKTQKNFQPGCGE